MARTFKVSADQRVALNAHAQDAVYAWQQYLDKLEEAEQALDVYVNRRDDLLDVVDDLAKSWRADFEQYAFEWRVSAEGTKVDLQIRQWENFTPLEDPPTLDQPEDDEPVTAQLDELPEPGR